MSKLIHRLRSVGQSWLSSSCLCFCFLFGHSLFSADVAKVDSFDKILVVPFSVMFNHRATPEVLAKLGVSIEIEKAETDDLVALYNNSKVHKLRNANLDGRVLIVALRNGKTINIMMDRWLNRLWIDGKVFKLTDQKFSNAINKLLASRKDAIEAAYIKKAFPEPPAE